MGTVSRVETILALLKTCPDRQQVAQQVGLKNRQSLDQHMRRQGYLWCREQQTYVPKESHPKNRHAPLPGDNASPDRAQQVIRSFATEHVNAQDIAKRCGFQDAQSMAKYMRSHGFEWSATDKNYVRHRNVQSEMSEPISNTEVAYPVTSSSQETSLNEFLPLLRYLQEHEPMLRALLEQTSASVQLPRYAIRGKRCTKSVYMSEQLAQLVNDFSKETNLHQSEIYEAALIEFLKRYGYRQQVNVWLMRT